jgi:hypothetical protein
MRVDMQDLSQLGDRLTEIWLLSVTVGRSFPEGQAQFLVTTFIRTTESALCSYERARLGFELSTATESLPQYLRAANEMELTFMALNRAMRLAVGLKTSAETTVSSADLPTPVEQDQLRKMRNAIDHNDGPIIKGRAGKGQTLALEVQEHGMVITDDGGTTQTVEHTVFAGWICKLHALASDLIHHPERWARTT